MQNLPKDPVMLLSVVNTMLRDKYDSLDAMKEDLSPEVAEDVIKKLKGINYEYSKEENRFL
ncbi:MAG: DUF4250 domain-containing protein [Lachnospiraceae bacterium]|nr:DUF4250 domain-containing protein [Lachnospiraceae bacterium]